MAILLTDLELLAQGLWDGLSPILSMLWVSLLVAPVATLAVVALFIYIWQGLD
jgi:hypothetical protein